MTWVVINKERGASYQAQTDTYLASLNVRICGNDYTANAVYIVRNLFAPPTPTISNPRPVFIAINCVTNSPSRRYRELLLNESYDGLGAQDFTANINNWRTIMDAVQAPPPMITDPRMTANGTFRFTIPAQRGRVNRVEGTTNLMNWVTLTNITGTNAPVVVRDTNVLANPRRFYRIRRL